MAAPFALPIRYSASGPIIGNTDGGEAYPGVGFQLRTVDLLDTAGALVFSGADQVMLGNAAPFILEMPNPRPGLRYSVEMGFDAETIADGGYDLDVCAAWSVDGGVFFKNAVIHENRFRQTSGFTTSDTCTYYAPATLGQGLPAPVLTGSTSLRVEFLAKIGAGAGQMSLPSTIYARLFETL